LLKHFAIAIDGPAASGKSTTARLVAEGLGLLHIDTGAMYRAVTLKAMDLKIDLDDQSAVEKLARTCRVELRSTKEGNRVVLDGDDVTSRIRTPRVTSAVSAVSSYSGVREVMVREQRRMAEQADVVLEGRDIGTVVLPKANLKIYMVANVAERARRRKKDLAQSGIEADEIEIAQEIETRDRKDSTRTASPLRKADDAVELDTSGLTIEEQVQFIVERARLLIRRSSAVGQRSAG
jgi:cytidylate kinase